MQRKPPSLKHIIHVNFAILGIEFCWAFLAPNISTIFILLGATPSTVSYLWLMPPFIGLILQPIIGQISDLTVSRYGKRRPYILIGLIATLLLCIALPFFKSLFFGALLLWMLFATMNIAHQPMRSLVADTIHPHQITLGFAVQTILIGIGAILGAALPWALSRWLPHNWPTFDAYLPPFITTAFFISGVVALGAGLWTCHKTAEYHDPVHALARKGVTPFSGLKMIFSHAKNLPKVLYQISLANFLMWVGFFTLFTYFNLSIAQTRFGLPPGVDVTSKPQYQEIMDQATAYNSLCFILFQIASFCVAALIPWITRFIHRKTVLSLAAAVGGIGFLSLFFNTTSFFIPAIAIGITWGACLAIHYAMVASNLPKDKMGLYFGFFNIACTSSQILVGILLGPIVKYLLSDQVTPAIAASGLFVLLGAFFNQRIQDKEK